MKKIPTVFERVYENHKVVGITSNFTNEECKEAFFYGIPTLKMDGACCAIINGLFYKRYDAKKGKSIPAGAIKCQDKPDPVTGHMPCWVRVDVSNPADKWFIEAYTRAGDIFSLEDGTYEAIGKHFQGNPYKMDFDILQPHGIKTLFFHVKPDEDYLEKTREYLSHLDGEGIVFWLDGKPVCKIKRTDFGMKWN